MKIYLLLLLLGLSLGAYRIPTFGSNQGYANSYFYLDVSSIKYGESINIQVTFYGYSSENCWLYYKGSSSYSDSEFTSGFSSTSSNTHSVTSSYYYDSYYYYTYEYKHSFYFTVTKTSTYNYLLLKVDKDSRYYVYIYHNRYNYLWIIWLVIGIVFVCLLIFLICFIKRRRAAQLALESQVSTLATPVYQPPVNAYQPQPQPQQYVQPAYPPQYQYAQPPPY
jgi:hypothetical protein